MYNPIEIGRIDRQIEDLQRLKASYQNMPQPINNIINTPATSNNTQPIFEAKFTTENPSDIFVQNKTAFIDLKNGKLSIKETDGDIKEYIIILPKDEKDLRIESLERKIKEMEAKFNNTFNVSNVPNEPIESPTINNESYSTSPIVLNDYDIVESTKRSKKGLVDKLKFKN